MGAHHKEAMPLDINLVFVRLGGLETNGALDSNAVFESGAALGGEKHF